MRPNSPKGSRRYKSANSGTSSMRRAVVEPRYSAAYPFSEGLARIQIGGRHGKWGFIDRTGAIVIEPQFTDVIGGSDESTSFHDGLAMIDVNVKQLVSNSGLADLGPQISDCHHDCWVSEFLALTREKGRRVFSHQAFVGNWIVVTANFNRLGQGDGARTHYNFERDIKGLEVLYENENLKIKDVWQQGDDIRIFVEREETEEEKASKERDRNSEANSERRFREFLQSQSLFSWRKLNRNITCSIRKAEQFKQSRASSNRCARKANVLYSPLAIQTSIGPPYPTQQEMKRGSGVITSKTSPSNPCSPSRISRSKACRCGSTRNKEKSISSTRTSYYACRSRTLLNGL